jgi:hypothetical protein
VVKVVEYLCNTWHVGVCGFNSQCTKEGGRGEGRAWAPVLMPVTIATQESKISRIMIQGQPRKNKKQELSQKYLTQKRVQEVECLPRKRGTLS